ncbi:SpaH/EbpB family LPXTG-anchored major pilin [uncultured Dubosiella sp.]|uniref:SpaH/EbpB family LPXTG-anchored major pilin n=2 Tax=uncultured Dubosiella sp. TaxID=1937011 RepID=UPI0025B3AC74|nr:SpaH/EbpB family LPXTG-anchored major pilin [uncultured Dubosiella sp.]
MKSLKKLLSIFAAFMMVVGLTAANVKAADGDTPSTNGTITLKDGREGVTYTPYQIFGLSVGANNGSYAYTIQKGSNFYNWMIDEDNGYLVADKPTTGGTQVDVVEAEKTNTPMWFTVNEANAITFSNAIYNAVKDGELTLPNAAGTAFTASKDNTTNSWTLPLGYYIIVPTMTNGNLAANVSEGAICNITTNAPNVTVAPKSSKPTVVKVAYEGDNKPTDGSVSVGDTLKFVLTGTMPDTTGYTTYNYVLTDTMRNLSYVANSATVKFGTQIMSTQAVTVNGKVLTLTFDATKYQQYVGEEITVEYQATVDATAVNKDENGNPVVIDNKVELKYGPNSDQDGNGTTVTFTTTKLPILKTDDTSDNAKPLAGAEFVLKQEGENGKYYVRNEDGTNGWGTEADATKLKSDEKGNLSFEGIAAGSYVLKEVKAPDGYSILTKDIKIEITKTETDNNVTYTVKVTNATELTNIVSATNNTVTVVNTTGNPLPSTGGMGTTMLYVAGAILMVGAAVIFVTNKRMKHE